MSRASARRRSGFAMLPVVLTLSLLATTAYLMTRESASGVALVASAQQTDRARYLAEAALRHADWQVQSADCNGFSDVPTTSFGADHYSATVTPTSGSPITVAATGTLADGTTHTLARTGVVAYEIASTQVLQLGTDPGKDVLIDSFWPSRNHGGTGYLRVSADPAWIQRTLLQFDLPSLPTGATILSARLELRMWSLQAPGTATAHRITRDWVEGTQMGGGQADGATWQTHDGTSSWSNPGGDFAAPPVAETSIQPGDTWVAWEVGSLVQQWADGTPNHGLLLRGEGTLAGAEFASQGENNPAYRPKLTITYACECGQVCGAAASPVPLLLVVSDASSLNSKESAGLALMESWGYAVTTINANASQEDYDTALADVDVVYISGSISSNDVGTKLTAATVGVLSEDAGLVDELGIAEPLFIQRNTQFVEIIDNTHYVTSDLSIGDLEIFSSPQDVWTVGGALAPGLQVLAETKVAGTGYPPGVAVLETGAALYGGGFAAGRRGQVPWSIGSAFDYNALTVDGLDIMERALEWAAGGSCTSLKPLLLVVSDAVSPSLQEAARQELLESWCYAVTRIDDDATSLELAAAMALPDVIYISQEITTLGVVSKLREANVGIVNEEYQISGELGFSSGYGSGFYSDIDIRDDAHYITSGLGLGLLALFEPAYDIYTGAGMTLAPDLQVLGATGSITGLAALDTGAALWGSGAAAGRRVLVPWGDDFSALNSDGQALMQRALEWAAGAGCGSRQKVLLVVGDDTLPLASRDAGRVALIESGCFTVSLIDDGDTQTNFNTAMDAADVVFVSGTSSGPALLDKLTGTTTGVVNEINGKLDNFGFSSSTASTVNADTFSNTDAAHYISEPFSGSLVTVFTTSLSMPVPGGTLAPDLQNVGEVSGTLALGTLETGATRWDGGVAPARRVHLPFGSAEITQMTADGQTLLQRAVEWAAGVGGGGGGGGPVSNVVFEEFTEERRSSPGGESVSIPKPAGTAAGDLLIVAAATDGNTASTLAPNGSWNLTQLDLGHNGNGSVTFGVWWKIADGTEPANLIYSWTGSEQAYGWIMRFTGHDPGSPIATAATSTGDSTDPLSTNLITSEDGMLILRLGGFDDDDITLDAPGLPGHTVITMDRSGTAVQNTVSGGAGYAAQATAGDTGTSNFALTKREQYRSVTIAIRPAP